MEEKMKITATIILLLLTAFLIANTAPVVSNITAAQRGDGSFKVDIYYDVYDADGDAMTITMQVSDDDGTTWNVSCNLATGDIGTNKYSGNGKHILWNVGSEHPDINTDFRFKIIADDGYTGGGGTCVDYDGNIYQTVIIGNQEWMAENLKVTHYRNGDAIPNVTDNGTWTSTSNGAYCVYNNTPANADTYGNLYNWYAVDDSRNIAPEGWHVPTDEEIKELEMALGMSQSEADDTGWRGTNEGSKLAGRADLWTNGALENNAEFDTSGFSFLPGGYRYFYNGDYSSISDYGYLWSSSESGSFAWYRLLHFIYTDVYRTHYYKRYGFSVRCFRD